ncbi:MAG: 30S ribosomal protein S6 [Clostridiales bacterium]|nr:30S ribosomal protein S6 [Clostridiales bacterium]
MNKYELTVVVNGGLSEEEAKAEFEKVQELIARFGGTVEKIDEWGKRRFAYEIDKMNDGYYQVVYFDGAAQTPGELESRLRIAEKIVRYLIVRVDE